MATIIDRRSNINYKMSKSVKHFYDVIRSYINDQIDKLIDNENIEDIIDGDKKLKAPKDIEKLDWSYEADKGTWNKIFPGNNKYRVGDTIPLDKAGGGQGKGSKSGKGDVSEDDFEFIMSEEEFRNILFQNLGLDLLVPKAAGRVFGTERMKAGYTTDGVPANLSLSKTFCTALARRIALKGAINEEIEKAKEDNKTQEEIDELEKRLLTIPYLDNLDLRYRLTVTKPVPKYKVVVMCVMDVSGSMSEGLKKAAKKFYLILLLLLRTVYPPESIELVFIRYHTEATECSQTDFFNKRETGGTSMEAPLTLINKLIDEKYNPNEYNIFIAHGTDGDLWINSEDDAQKSIAILNKILTKINLYFYVQLSFTEIMSGIYAYATDTVPVGADVEWSKHKFAKYLYDSEITEHKRFRGAFLRDPNDLWDMFKALFKVGGSYEIDFTPH